MRLDKWLWVARFFKTRNLAADAVTGGKVYCNGERSKPGKLLKVGDKLNIRRGIYEYVVQIIGLSKRRVSAKEVQALYQETEDSIQARELAQQRAKAESQFQPKNQQRPNKRQRRQLIAVKTRQ